MARPIIKIIKNGPYPASFCSFSFFSHDKYSTNLIINDNVIDGVLGTQTRASRMVGADKSTMAAPRKFSKFETEILRRWKSGVVWWPAGRTVRRRPTREFWDPWPPPVWATTLLGTTQLLTIRIRISLIKYYSFLIQGKTSK